MENNIRVRFAPSPTGALHVGNARTALYNWLYAHKNNGKFILRIEDTDVVRSTKESEASIISELNWLGVQCDEGPENGGDFGPYRQSERTDMYTEYLNKLLDEKKAYNCYCTTEELDAVKSRQIANSQMPSYSGKCRDLTDEQRAAFEAEGRSHVVRLKVPGKRVVFTDLVKGQIAFYSNSLGGDFVIIRSNGGFMYNFTVVIDDALMKMSHIIRGEDHLTNTVKQILLYEALGFKPPRFAHCPMILGEDKKRLSKRFLRDSFATFHNEGIMPAALMNYIAMLGWSSRDGSEIFSPGELIEKFSLQNVSSSPSVFQHSKLRWVNGEHIKLMSDDDFARALSDFVKRALPDFGAEPEHFNAFARIIKTDTVILKDALAFIDMFFSDEPELTDDAAQLLKQTEAVDVARAFLSLLADEPTLDAEAYKSITKKIKKSLNVGGKGLFMPLRAAISGRLKGPNLGELCEFLGGDAVAARIEKRL